MCYTYDTTVHFVRIINRIRVFEILNLNGMYKTLAQNDEFHYTFRLANIQHSNNNIYATLPDKKDPRNTRRTIKITVYIYNKYQDTTL